MSPASRASLTQRGLPALLALSGSLLLHGVLPWAPFRASARPEPVRVSLQLTRANPIPLLPAPEEELEEPVVDPEPPAEALAPAEAPGEALAPAEAPAPTPVRSVGLASPAAPPPPLADAEEPTAQPTPAPPASSAPVPASTPRVDDEESRPAPAPSAQGARADAPSAGRPARPRRLQRIERLAQLAKRRGSARSAVRAKSDRAGSGGRTVANGASDEEKAEAVYACTAEGLGPRLDVRRERPLTDWVTVVPTVLMPFETRPSLGAYLEGVAQVTARSRRGAARAGPVEFALPANVVQLELDAPRGVRVALGHLEGRCLVGFRYQRQLFPLTLHRVPARIIDADNRTAKVLVDVTLYKDGSFRLTHKGGDVLPFDEGRLENADGIKRTIESHYAAARALREMAGWFGIDLTKLAREERAKKARNARRQEVAQRYRR